MYVTLVPEVSFIFENGPLEPGYSVINEVPVNNPSGKITQVFSWKLERRDESFRVFEFLKRDNKMG